VTRWTIWYWQSRYEAFSKALRAHKGAYDERVKAAAHSKITAMSAVNNGANRFARDLMVQEVGYAMLRERGIDLIAADSPTAFLDDGPTSKLIRQVLGAVAEFDKAMTVAKLRGARERRRRENGKCEGRKGHHELRPAVVRMAKRLAQASRTGERRSLRQIAAKLAEMGHMNDAGKPFAAASIKAMIDGPMPTGDEAAGRP
jgi:hypothetical protein